MSDLYSSDPQQTQLTEGTPGANLPETGSEKEKKPKKTKRERRYFWHGILTGVLCSVLIVCLLVLGLGIYLRSSDSALNTASISKLRALEKIIENYYYEDVDTETLEDGLYSGLFEALGDPYSSYYTAEEYEELSEQLTGSYAGIGATLTQNSDTKQCTVVRVYDGTPAQEAGLATGDEIVSADGNLATDYDSLDDFVALVRGEAGTSVELEVIKADTGETVTLSVTRASITIPTVSYEMMDDGIGYIRIDQFTSSTYDAYIEAMDALTEQGMEAVIFDLRANGGGLVSSVTDILDDILPAGTTVYMLDKDGNRTDYTSDDEHQRDLPIAVLTSEDTASAAEIFSGAIRDFEYGTLIGQTTYGKGIVQQTIPLADGSAIKLTIQTYYTPSGECIHKTGITPDIEMEYEYTGESTSSSDYDLHADNQAVKAEEILLEELGK